MYLVSVVLCTALYTVSLTELFVYMYTVVVVEDLHIIIIHVQGLSSLRRSRERERGKKGGTIYGLIHP